jgi:hypothetical protein
VLAGSARGITPLTAKRKRSPPKGLTTRLPTETSKIPVGERSRLPRLLIGQKDICPWTRRRVCFALSGLAGQSKLPAYFSNHIDQTLTEEAAAVAQDPQQAISAIATQVPKRLCTLP